MVQENPVPVQRPSVASKSAESETPPDTPKEAAMDNFGTKLNPEKIDGMKYGEIVQRMQSMGLNINEIETAAAAKESLKKELENSLDFNPEQVSFCFQGSVFKLKIS